MWQHPVTSVSLRVGVVLSMSPALLEACFFFITAIDAEGFDLAVKVAAVQCACLMLRGLSSHHSGFCGGRSLSVPCTSIKTADSKISVTSCCVRSSIVENAPGSSSTTTTATSCCGNTHYGAQTPLSRPVSVPHTSIKTVPGSPVSSNYGTHSSVAGLLPRLAHQWRLH